MLRKWTEIYSNSKGQITIFFSTTILVLITFLAFIINIGVFVKAKINLQNATDAAAYAGASVQARQLTDIGYLNWEMRNIYKEWMFKYYILGGLNLDVFKGSGPNSKVGSSASFRMTSVKYGGSREAKDSYNFPSVCIDFSNTQSAGLCSRYLVPGLPRFSSSNIIGMDETTNSFIDAIVSEKAKDCSRRSQINFFTANAWAYNVNVDDPSLTNISAQAPQIALESGGAFPNAFELALRMRNLEARVNTPPYSRVCATPGTGADCTQGIDSIISGNQHPGTERIVKAYQSGARNLGSEGDREMRASFTLTELAPTPYSESNINGLSNLLIPSGSPALEKHYLDLKIMTVNYSTFYTAFTPSQGTFEGIGSSGLSAASEAQCAATKIGLPVPGYIMGFVKNPDVLTYYAVKGEANFIGLFNPFSSLPIKLSAYAAAKPFGGRIGPHLFNTTRDSSKIFPRSEQRSSPYISTIDTSNLLDLYGNPAGSNYVSGAPLPINLGSGSQKFWLDPSDTDGAIGGWVPGQEIYFGIPNIPYDYPNITDREDRSRYTAIQNIETITPMPEITNDPEAGLYNRDILEKLWTKLPGAGSGSNNIDAQSIQNALTIVKSPTYYDMANYLIPTHENHNAALSTDSFGTITDPNSTSLNVNNTPYTVYDANIYAPILGEGTIYSSTSDLAGVLDSYIANLEPAVKKYISAMNLAASTMYKGNVSTATGQRTAPEAARAISDIPDAALGSDVAAEISEALPTCKSISGKFAKFLLGQSLPEINDPDCVTSISELMQAKWATAPPERSQAHSFTYSLPNSLSESPDLFSAYRPGPLQGNTEEGLFDNPTNDITPMNMIRNSYSTKFIPLSSIANSSSYFYINNVVSEGSYETKTIENISFKNPLQTEEIDVDLSTIRH